MNIIIQVAHSIHSMTSLDVLDYFRLSTEKLR